MKNTRQLNKKNVARLSVKIQDENFDQLTEVEQEMFKNKYYVKLNNKLNKLIKSTDGNTVPEVKDKYVTKKDFARLMTNIYKYKVSENKKIRLIKKLRILIRKSGIGNKHTFLRSAILTMCETISMEKNK